MRIGDFERDHVTITRDVSVEHGWKRLSELSTSINAMHAATRVLAYIVHTCPDAIETVVE